MSKSDIIALVQYNNWANARILASAALVPSEQLTIGTTMNGKSAFDTLRHMVDVEWSWRLACQELPVAQELWKIEPLDDLAAVADYWHAEGERLLAFVQALPEEDLARKVVPSWSQRPNKIGDILLHIMTHAIGHRSEVGWYLTSLGHSPGDTDFLDYVDSRKETKDE